MPDTHLEERIAGLEGSYRELTKRIDDLRSEMHRGFDGVRAELDNVRTRLDGLGGDMKGLRDELRGLRNELRGEMSSNFRWTMSLILINWLSLLGGIFLVALKKLSLKSCTVGPAKRGSCAGTGRGNRRPPHESK